MDDVTQILSQIESGDTTAANELLPLVYDALRELATAKLAREDANQTLQATALVHEAYVRLVDSEKVQHWNSRGHFFAAAAQSMRRILVDNARRKKAQKHGGQLQRRSANLDEIREPSPAGDILAIDEALEKLSHDNPPVAKLVELKFFGGLTLEEAASALNVSSRTAYRYWAYAKAWLHHEISEAEQD